MNSAFVNTRSARRPSPIRIAPDPKPFRPSANVSALTTMARIQKARLVGAADFFLRKSPSLIRRLLVKNFREVISIWQFCQPVSVDPLPPGRPISVFVAWSNRQESEFRNVIGGPSALPRVDYRKQVISLRWQTPWQSQRCPRVGHVRHLTRRHSVALSRRPTCTGASISEFFLSTKPVWDCQNLCHTASIEFPNRIKPFKVWLEYLSMGDLFLSAATEIETKDLWAHRTDEAMARHSIPFFLRR